MAQLARCPARQLIPVRAAALHRHRLTQLLHCIVRRETVGRTARGRRGAQNIVQCMALQAAEALPALARALQVRRAQSVLV